MGKEIENAASDEVMNWKDKRVGETLRELVGNIKTLNKDFEFGFCTGYESKNYPIEKYQVAQSIKPEIIKQTGIDYVFVYGEDNIRPQVQILWSIIYLTLLNFR